jgi:hypothetical protein
LPDLCVMIAKHAINKHFLSIKRHKVLDTSS